MKRCTTYLLIGTSLLLGGCHCSKCQDDDEVVSKRYIHKYGYDVSPTEWEEASYPGKVITTLRDGIVVTSSYEDNILEGEMTTTYPHSQTIAVRKVYEKGNLVKKTSYDLSGIPEKEETFFSPSHRRLLCWYKSGTPMSVEEYEENELIEAEYYNACNEVDYKVVQGEGIRISRDEHGKLSLRETISHGYSTLKETFYPHGIPHTITPLLGGQIHGEKKVYARTGEPISIESHSQSMLHGMATYFQNGHRYLEIDYLEGLRHGKERHFIDGKTVVEETTWYEGKKHGPSTLYSADSVKQQTRWYYNDQLTSKDKYRQLSLQEDNIAIMQERVFHSGDIEPDAVR